MSLELENICDATLGEHVDLKKDMAVVVGIAAAVFFLRIIVMRLLFVKLGKRVLALTGKTAITPIEQSTLDKVTKYMYHFVFYIFMWGWGLYELTKFEWAFQPFNLVDVSEFERLALKPFLTFEGAWYCFCFMESFVYDKKRGDYWMMLGHHIVTISLILGAFYLGAVRVSIAITTTFDIGDICMYAAKILHNDKSSAWTKWRSVEISAVASCWTVWFCTRILYYMFIIYSMWVHVPCGFSPFKGLALFLQVMLSILLLMQVIWVIGFGYMLMQLIKENNIDDFFSEDQDEIQAKKAEKKTE